MAHTTAFLRSFILPAALLLGGFAHAEQASFAVSVTLHSASKALAAMQLCPNGRPLALLTASSVRIECPTGLNDKTANSQNTGTTNLSSSLKPLEVVVVF